MIIPSKMTDDEICSYILNDYDEIFPLIEKDKNNFRRKVLSEARNYPYKKIYKHISIRNIDYKIIFIAEKRGCYDKPKYTPVAIYNADEGKYMAMITAMVTLYSPHFLKDVENVLLKTMIYQQKS